MSRLYLNVFKNYKTRTKYRYYLIYNYLCIITFILTVNFRANFYG